MTVRNWAHKVVMSTLTKLDRALETAANPKRLFQDSQPQAEQPDYLEDRKNEIRAQFISDAVKEHYPDTFVSLGSRHKSGDPAGSSELIFVKVQDAGNLHTLLHEVAHTMVREMVLADENYFSENKLVEEILVETYANAMQMNTLQDQERLEYEVQYAVDWLYEPEIMSGYVQKYDIPESEQLSRQQMLNLFSNPASTGLEALFNHPLTQDMQAALHIDPSYDFEYQRELRNTPIEKAFYDQITQLKYSPHFEKERFDQTLNNFKICDLLNEKFYLEMVVQGPETSDTTDAAHPNTLIIDDVSDIDLLNKTLDFLNERNIDPTLIEAFNQQALELTTSANEAPELNEPVSLDKDDWTVW